MVQGASSRRPRRRQLLALAAALLVVAAGAVAPGAIARPLFTSNAESHTISVIDTGTQTVSGGPIDVADAGETAGVAITPDGRTLFVVGFGSNKVYPIDTQARQMIGQPITVGSHPGEIAISPDGSRAYVTNFESNSVSVIDVGTLQTVGNPIVVGTRPEGIAISPNGSRAYVANEGTEDVSVIDTGAGIVSDTVKVGKFPTEIAITPDGAQVYVTNLGSNTVSAIDTATNLVLGQPIPVGQGPVDVAISPDGKRAYVANLVGESLSIVDTQARATLLELKGITEALGVAVTPDGKTVYATEFIEAGALVPVDTSPPQLGAPIPLGQKKPGLIAIVPDQPPVAAFSTPRARPGVEVAFDASASTDPDGTIATYAWNFGDRGGAHVQAPKATHSFAAPGTYSVNLTLTDNENCSTSLVFTGQTASCNGSSLASATQKVTVAYPGVRVRCPKRAGAGGCRVALQAVAKKPRKGKRAKPQSAVSRVKLGAGRSAILSLKAKNAFRVRLARATSVLVREKRTIAGSQTVRFRRLKIVR